jgi:hypothetical protein
MARALQRGRCAGLRVPQYVPQRVLGTFSVTQPLFATVFPGDTAMAVNKPVGDNARKGAVRKRPQLETKIMGEKHWSKRNKESGQFMDQKEKGKFKGVRRER